MEIGGPPPPQWANTGGQAQIKESTDIGHLKVLLSIFFVFRMMFLVFLSVFPVFQSMFLVFLGVFLMFLIVFFSVCIFYSFGCSISFCVLSLGF